MREQEIKRGDVRWINPDPTQGSEIRKTRPCVVLTHDTLDNLRRTVVVVPLSTAARPYPPITVPVTCQTGAVVAVIDQIRAVANLDRGRKLAIYHCVLRKGDGKPPPYHCDPGKSNGKSPPYHCDFGKSNGK
uniref:mRNA-degrading endonuclease, toxin component of the MazEF toxin-antitoxin module n=1 Tax=Candidatus Kentrum sp. LFY TaxID=2126342 RepID=A0A450V309_9GAMM|nr:MAG: mRNA-degrading endonuclease, toxin component of the MazEF toxin-antitoxin module [Candidatus Kentron sp. LFY]